MTILAADSPSDSATTSAQPPRATDWRGELRRAVRDPAQLLAVLELPLELLPAAERASGAFPLFAPWPFIGRMHQGDPVDPLLLQVLPVGEEAVQKDGFVHDAVGDGPANIAPGAIQKYSSRALLIAAGACAIHCRYCFRRHFPYDEAPHGIEEWKPTIDRLGSDPQLDEAILSGGDPLMLVDSQLAELVRLLAAKPNLRRLRVHTRLPIVIPQRVTDDLLAALTQTRLTPYVVVHLNHPQEIDSAVETALARLSAAGIVLLNQAVLLRGVNDNANALVELSQKLVDLRVLPYYLHQLDRVQGAAHFEVPIPEGLELIAQMRSRLPGYAVPRYVQEIAGDDAKRVLA